MDLRTTYLGLPLRNPLVAAASPLSQSEDGVIRLVDAGVGAVVLHSLFEEQILQEVAPVPHQEAPHHFVNPAGPGAAPRYLRLVERAARSVDVPVIASVNGSSRSGWAGFARQLEDAGAAAVECNLFLVPELGRSSVDVERWSLEVVAALRAAVSVPVAVKVTPYYSSFGTFATRLVEAGADGLVLFSRFLQPVIDVTTLSVTPAIGLSEPSDARLPQTWIAVLREELPATSLAGTGGVETAEDLAAYLLAGADVVQCASALLRHGRDHAATLLDGLSTWAAQHGFTDVGEVRGRLAVPRGEARRGYAREGYVAALQTARRGYVNH